jgi:hypothetical protein
MLSLSSSLFRLGVGGADHGLLDQIISGCTLVDALACLASTLAAGGAALTQVQAVQLASSLAVVWQLGRNMLQQGLNGVRAGRMVGMERERYNLFGIASCQSLAVASMLGFLHHHAPPGAAASVARSFMKPATVLPWLEAVAEVSELVMESAREPGEPPVCSAAWIVCGPAACSATAAATILDRELAAKKNAAGLLC